MIETHIVYIVQLDMNDIDDPERAWSDSFFCSEDYDVEKLNIGDEFRYRKIKRTTITEVIS